MRGHFDFGNDGDVAFRGVSEQLADVVLRVKPAVSAGRPDLAVAAPVFLEPPVFPHRFGTPSGELRQARILFDFDAPAGPVGEVQMQPVQLEARHRVHLFLDEFLRAEMPRNVHHESPIRKTRRIRNDAGGNGPGVPVRRGFRKLQQRLQPVKKPRVRPRFDAYPFRRYAQRVAFGRIRRRRFRLQQQNAGGGSVVRFRARPQQRPALRVSGEPFPLCALQIAENRDAGRDGERALRQFHFRRNGNDGLRLRRKSSGAAQRENGERREQGCLFFSCFFFEERTTRQNTEKRKRRHSFFFCRRRVPAEKKTRPPIRFATADAFFFFFC